MYIKLQSFNCVEKSPLPNIAYIKVFEMFTIFAIGKYELRAARKWRMNMKAVVDKMTFRYFWYSLHHLSPRAGVCKSKQLFLHQSSLPTDARFFRLNNLNSNAFIKLYDTAVLLEFSYVEIYCWLKMFDGKLYCTLWIFIF